MLNFLKEHNRGIIATIIFHGIVLLMFLFWGFRTPLPLPAEEGILINFGETDFGSGEIEPETSPIDEQKYIPPSSSQSSQSETDTEEEILDQDYEEAASIENENKNKEQEISENKDDEDEKVDQDQNAENEEEQPEQIEPEREVNERALFPGRNDSENDSQSEGVIEGEGNQGSPSGDPESDNYNKGNSGSGGISYNLAGRYPESLPKPKYPVNEQGKVVVEVTVDKYGNVTSANPGVKGSTTSNKLLLQAAKEAALKAKFDKKAEAPAFQKGTIVYHFVLQ
jgi:colicin import membrane protein